MAVRKIFLEAGSLAYSLEAVVTRLVKAQRILRQLKMKPVFRRMIEGALIKLFEPSRTIAAVHKIHSPSLLKLPTLPGSVTE